MSHLDYVLLTTFLSVNRWYARSESTCSHLTFALQQSIRLSFMVFILRFCVTMMLARLALFEALIQSPPNLD
jgi:hypothetical protein